MAYFPPGSMSPGYAIRPLIADFQHPSCMCSPHVLISKFPKILKIALGIVSTMALVAPATAQIHRLNSDEMTLFKRIAANSGQQRDTVALDPILCIVARKRAADMANRH